MATEFVVSVSHSDLSNLFLNKFNLTNVLITTNAGNVRKGRFRFG
jgi:hypothetical protein